MKEQKRKNRGSTLLFAVMVMAFVITMGLAVAQVIFAELKISGDFASSQAAYYAAEGGLELGLLNGDSAATLSNNAQYNLVANPILDGGYFFQNRGLFGLVQRKREIIIKKPDMFGASEKGFALKTDGSLWGVGYEESGEFGLDDGSFGTYQEWTFLTDEIIDFASGWSHSVALKSDGTVWTTGYNDYGSLGTGDFASTSTWKKANIDNVVDISVGEFSTLVLKSDGTVWGVGTNWFGELGIGFIGNYYANWQQARVSGTEYLTGIVSLGNSQLSNHSVAIADDGTLYATGNNGEGQLGLGHTNEVDYFVPILNNIKQVMPAYFHTLALDNNSNLWVTGDNSWGQIGLDMGVGGITSWQKTINDVVDISGAQGHSLVIKSNGDLWGTGIEAIGFGWDDNYGWIDTGLRDIINIYAGHDYSYAIKKDGKYYATGENYRYHLGLGDNNYRENWEINSGFQL